MADAKSQTAKGQREKSLRVVRDSTFHRAVVDTAFVVGVGDSVELACLQAGRSLNSFGMDEEGLNLTGDETVTEVVRLRMSWAAARITAMNILGVGIGSGRLDRAEIIERINKFTLVEASDAS